ncbi:hypothetical protein ACWC9H_27300 [Streptomyces sp. NPDC001251]
MRTITEAVGETAARQLAQLVISGPLRAIHANGDGSWTIVPVTGQPLILTGRDEVTAYIERATHGTGPQALAPARPITADTGADDEACACRPAIAPALSPQHHADMMQARAILTGLAAFGVRAARRSAAFDETAQAVAVRVQSGHGLYALHIPPAGMQFPVHRNGCRDGVIGARRVPATTDSMVTALYASYLRDRAAL